jgi:heme/copper-type cytochrome/quinol oxidase subunit 3
VKSAVLPAPQLRHAEATALLGMVVFIAAWAMLFAGLFFAYGAIRVRAAVWPPPDLPRLPVGLPALATGLLALSSAALQSALAGARRGEAAVRGVGLALLLGLGFLALQTTVWRQLVAGGLRPTDGNYGSSFYALTVFHALHVAVGLGALAWLAVSAWRSARAPGAASSVSLRLWTLYWHMVGAIWLVMFVAVYLV